MESTLYKEAVQFIQEKITIKPKIGLILGSGLGVLTDDMTDCVTIPYETVPHFPRATVEGHAGEWVIGKLSGIDIAVMKGRFHFYEGHHQKQVTFPVRVMKYLGIRNLIVTNAAGGIHPNFSAGDFMLITDHLNLMGTNPLIGPNDDRFGPRFPDMSEVYSLQLRMIAKRAAQDLQIPLQEGVYAAMVGPVYETPAEVRMIATLGGDAVGMSTVPEAIVANHSGLSVLGLSVISNLAAGIQKEKLSHQEVMETAKQVRSNFIQLIKKIVFEIGEKTDENG
ncbi:MAG TPA: purine-nucleoside phosphorylase [Firmicutes bacterium]|nr:purine-nucleoside phosphorylase [Bacillota bacterium]